MLPKLTPLGKTSIELRRAINRLETYIEQNPHAEDVTRVQVLITDLKEARNHIPVELRDPDGVVGG